MINHIPGHKCQFKEPQVSSCVEIPEYDSDVGEEEDAVKEVREP